MQSSPVFGYENRRKSTQNAKKSTIKFAYKKKVRTFAAAKPDNGYHNERFSNVLEKKIWSLQKLALSLQSDSLRNFGDNDGTKTNKFFELLVYKLREKKVVFINS